VERFYWAGILSFIVTFSFWGITYIAVELEQPFGDDANDLPLHQMQMDMNARLQSLLDVRAHHAPKYIFRKEHQNMTRASEHIERLFRSKTKSTDVETPHGVSLLPDVLVTYGTADVETPHVESLLPHGLVTGGNVDASAHAPHPPQVEQEHTLVKPKLVSDDPYHLAVPPPQNEFHGKDTEFPKQDTFPEALPPLVQASQCRDHACISMQPIMEEFASPGPAVRLATALRPCDKTVSDGVDHPNATAWQRVAQRSLEYGSGSDDAMHTSIVTPMRSYLQTQEHAAVTADAGGTDQSAVKVNAQEVQIPISSQACLDAANLCCNALGKAICASECSSSSATEAIQLCDVKHCS